MKNSFVVSNNDNFFVENGILYSVEKHEDENGNIEEIVTLLRAPTDTTTSKVNISDRTNYIASGAFANCSYSNIILNSNLIGIGDYAFKNCLKLQYITVQEGTEYIGRGAFENCIKLVLPTLPATISSLSVELFKNCTSLETIKLPTTLTEIGDSAFNGCTSLEKLHFTNSVNDIASNAFEGCSSLTTIEIDSGNKVYGYDGGGLYNVAYNSLTNKYEPVELVQVIVQTDTLTLPATVSNIAESAFDSLDLVNSLTVDSRNQYFKFVKDKSIAGTDVDNTGALFKLDPSGNCAELFFVPKSSTSITLDKNVNSISAYAFSHLGDDFKSINVASDNANYTAVGTTDNYVLYNKDKTTLVKVPVAADVNEIATTCTTISKGAFYGNKVVDSLVFSDGINNISDGEFLDTNLKNISNINQYMINKYNKLFSADNIETVDHIKATTIPGATFYGMVGLRSVTLDEGVTLIDNAAFKNCSNLTTFSLPSSVETVGNAAFENCFSMSNFTFATTNSLLTIGNAVFKGCTSLTTLTNLSNCTVLDTLGKEAFMGCTALTSIDFSATKVSTFNESVFANCTSLTSITFNQRENAIKAYAFKNTGFTTFTLPANISDVNLDVTCFDDCSKLVAFRASSSSNTRFHNGLLSTDSAYLYYNNNSKLIKIPNALTGAVAITQTTTTTIATNAFRGCNKITSAQLGNGSNSSINSITDGELKDCTSLTTVTLTNDYLVQQYSKMITKDDGTKLAVTDVKIGNFIGAIADESFKDCTALVNVTAYNPSNSMTSFTKIGNNAFSGCTSLTTLFDLTNSSQSTSSVNRLAYLAEFGTSAFENCSSMQYFTLPKVLRTIGNNAFKGCSSIISIKTRSNYITSSSATWNPDGLNFS